MRQILSVDLWNTIIKPSVDYYSNLATYSSKSSDLNAKKIKKIIITKANNFDEKAICDGVDISSYEKIRSLIESTLSSASIDEIHEYIKSDLLRNPPVFVEKDCIKNIESFCRLNNTEFVISSNSGFASGETMRTIIGNIGISKSKFYAGSFFSDEIKHAKPSKLFFEWIEKITNGKIILHIGDRLESDCSLQGGYNSLLFATRATKNPPTKKVLTSFNDLSRSML